MSARAPDLAPPRERPLLLRHHVGVLYAGINAAANACAWGDRRPIRFGINLILTGWIEHRGVEGAVERLHAGDAFQRVPFHRQQTCHCSSDYRECFVSVDETSMQHLVALACIDPTGNLLQCSDRAATRAGFQSLYQAMAMPAVDASDLLLQAASWFRLFQLRPDAAWRDAETVTRAKHYLLERLQQRFLMRDAAQALGLPYARLRKLFKRETGQGIGDWLIDQRLQRARYLLSGYSVQETAEQLGYPDASTFSRQFSQHLGLSPRAFQEKLAGDD